MSTSISVGIDNLPRFTTLAIPLFHYFYSLIPNHFFILLVVYRIIDGFNTKEVGHDLRASKTNYAKLVLLMHRSQFKYHCSDYRIRT